jgi:formylglycine-generating enzyme required for sulfatase activity
MVILKMIKIQDLKIKFSLLLIISFFLLLPLKGIAEEYKNNIGMEFVLIPAGTFLMGPIGETELADNDEFPRHRVTITKAFYMGKYEVTQEQWVKIMNNNPSRHIGKKLPVDSVSWHEAQEFLEAINDQNPGQQYRLPTEAEWEYAARANSTKSYFFGDDERKLPRYAWFDETSKDITHPIGKLKPNAWGLYDIYGNVWEWCQDWYGPYPEEAVKDPTGPESGKYRTLRGGSWCYYDRYCRSANRGYNLPDYKWGLGLRLVLVR